MTEGSGAAGGVRVGPDPTSRVGGGGGAPAIGFLVALGPLLYTYMPRPPIAGAHLLVYPLMAGVLALLLFHLLGRRDTLDLGLFGLLLLLLLLNLAVALSFLVNAGDLRARAPVELLRVGLLAVFLLYGFAVGRMGGDDDVGAGLRWAAYLILLGELVVASTQMAGWHVFDLLYSAEKSRPFGSLLRATGTFGNPNAFAWMVAQAGVMALVFDSSRWRYLALLVASLLVVSSGSRTLLLLFPVMLAWVILRGRGGWRQKLGALLLLGGTIGTAFFAAVYFLARFFPYLAQLRLVFTAGSLLAVNSVRARFVAWEAAIQEFRDAGWHAWAFGLGSRDSTAVLDNDYLFILVRLGALGFLVHLALVACLAAFLSRRRRDAVAAVGLEYLLFSLVLGLVSETLGGWNVPLLLFLLAGLALPARGGTRGAHPPLRRT